MAFRYPLPLPARNRARDVGWIAVPLALSLALVLSSAPTDGWGLWRLARMAPPDIGLGLFGLALAGLAGGSAWRIAALSTAPLHPGRIAAHLTAPLLAAATLTSTTLIPGLCTALFASGRATRDHRRHRVVALLVQCSALAVATGLAHGAAGGAAIMGLTLGIAAFSALSAPRAAANDNPSMKRRLADSWLIATSCCVKPCRDSQPGNLGSAYVQQQ